MKRLLKQIYKNQQRQEYLQLFNDIKSLLDSGLSVNELELYLDINIKELEEEILLVYFKEYIYLLNLMNSLLLIRYISFYESLKSSLINTLSKKLIYPIILFIISFVALNIFKHSLVKTLSDYITFNLLILINLFYYISLILIFLVLILLLLTLYLSSKPDILVITFNRFKNIGPLNLIELFYIKILLELLYLADLDGLSTNETFKMINSFKKDTVISNIAYFLDSDLEDGLGINESINNMRISKDFKRILIFSIESNKYRHFLKTYQIKLDNDISNYINNLSKKVFIITYVYIGFLLLIFYKILTVPLNLINSI